ncbi:Twin-arginine translocation protein TatC [Anaerovibrio sp. JC8]|uniref:twin-arginine translocase subunit TatC n=1 Tax=Anaerovibrio sp. JC8 TaxID=1240085 RepID=UPI000A09F9BF|nr:twin-arginine translocase subunit TatC [Anaerovibrio sp. JC8]ORU01393.1 Twin-arginine translocation protein TatC [Anaerovibrio sp. JC8]
MAAEENSEVRPEDMAEREGMADPGEEAIEAKNIEEADTEDSVENDAEEISDDDNMSILEHLTELRKRLIRCVIAILVGSCITYAFDEKIMEFLLQPAGKLYFMHPGEAFFSYAKVVLFSGFLLATPVVFYEIWRFFVPAFTRRERMVLGIMVPSSILLFYIGLAFSFFMIVPIGIKFFMGMGSDDLSPLFSVEKYLDFIITFLLPFGLAFELPLIIIILAALGIVTSKQLQKYFRYVFFVSFIIGALLTPPDIISQITLALPLTALYGLSYLVVRFVLRK